MFSYQQNFFSPTKEVTRDTFWALVGAPFTEECITKFRETHDAAWKKRLPAFIFQATFDVTKSKKGLEGAWRKQAATRLTGLVVMDVDHVESEELRMKCEAFAAADFSQRAKELGILLIYITPSGKGLKIVFKARQEWGNLIDNQHMMAKALGVEIDESCKDASRMSFICRKEDILFINEEELFTYENHDYSERFSALYRDGHSQATRDVGCQKEEVRCQKKENEEELCYHGVEYGKICEAWLDGKLPKAGDRHATALKLACDLRYITDNDAKLMEQILRSLTWVDEIVKERNEDVALIVKSAREYKMLLNIPKRMQAALLKAGVKGDETAEQGDTPSARGVMEQKLVEWGQQIAGMFDTFPCLRECCQDLRPSAYPAALYTSAAFFGTDMTRTWWHFWHRPEEVRRLNYCVMIIGDPGTGKSFATRLFKLIAAPLIAADKVGNDAMNRYKKEVKKRGTSLKEQKKEGLEPPDVMVRVIGTRTSNGVFIENMNKAVEIVGGEPFHLHLLTFDSELDSATMASKGGQWIDKSVFELKAFHNEEDDQHYKNNDAFDGPFDVFWNFVYTGTPLSLHRKVTERNFGSGLFSRLGVVPFPSSNFRMMQLRRQSKVNHAADETLKSWAFRLDGVKGELPLWPLAEHTYYWMAEKMEVARFNADKADEMLLKRVPYYGVCVATPFILMRHWEEWQKSHTFEIDDKDRELCTLVMEIQHTCQRYYFGHQAKMYYDNSERDEETNRRRASKYDLCYEQLPETFTVENVEKVYKVTNSAAKSMACRLARDGFVKRLKKGAYQKIRASLL